MNVYRNKERLAIYVREADIEIKMYPATFADPDTEQTWPGTRIFYRSGGQATEFTTTDLEALFLTCYHPAIKIVRVVMEAERQARQTGVPQAVSYRPGASPTAFFGPAAFRRPGEPWVEIAPDGIAVWRNEEEA